MKLVVDMNTPHHVHFFKNFIKKMKERGHKILVTASDKDVSLRLLDSFGLDYTNLGDYGSSIIKKLVNIPVMNVKLYKIVKSFKPDVFIGVGSIRAAQVSKIMNKPCINFDDTEHSKEQHILYLPFTDIILTPSCFKKDFDKRKHIRYDGYQELAYLHPNYFKPDLSILDEINLSKEDVFTVVRFGSWSATHDIGQCGIKNRREVIKKLGKHSYVVVSSEGKIESSLEKYKVKIPPEKLHDLLYYATLYFGEGATTASECAILGTHAIYINSLKLGYIEEEEVKYNLVYSFSDKKTMQREAINKALELLENDNLKRIGKKKRKRLLKDKIDVTAFMVWFIENYPESFKELKINPKIEEKFRICF